jgi:hypothetical protein
MVGGLDRSANLGECRCQSNRMPQQNERGDQAHRERFRQIVADRGVLSPARAVDNSSLRAKEVGSDA